MTEAKAMQDLEHEETIKKCPECGSKEFDFRDGERFCKKCGLVLD